MRTIYNRAKIILLLALVVVAGLVFIAATYCIHGNEYVMKSVNKHLYSGGALVCGGEICDRNGYTLVNTVDGERNYCDNIMKRKSMLHIIGDQYGYITGVQSLWSSELVGYNLFYGVNNSVASGGNTLTLTLDSDVCAAALNALNGQKGTVGVYNYKTGEIICDVSTPTYDVYNKPDDIDEDESGKYNGIYLNKLFYGQYTPGSVFKTVTACCAIENISDIWDREFTCTGEWTAPDGQQIICNDVHGTISFEQAFNCSCNIAFAQLSIELGGDKLTEVTNRLGLTGDITTDRITTAKGKFDVSNASSSDLGWAGFGQYTDIANPCAIMVMMGAIANNGKAVKPYFVESVASRGVASYSAKTEYLGTYMSESTAQSLQKILRSTITDYYGESKFWGLEICAKSGTAELDDDVESHSWFAGYSQRDDMPYAFVVIVENGGGGYANAGTIAGYVMNAVYDYIVNS